MSLVTVIDCVLGALSFESCFILTFILLNGYCSDIVVHFLNGTATWRNEHQNSDDNSVFVGINLFEICVVCTYKLKAMLNIPGVLHIS